MRRRNGAFDGRMVTRPAPAHEQAQHGAARRGPAGHLVEHLFLYKQARTSATALAVIKDDGRGGASNGRLQIYILEDDVGRFAAQMERDLLEIASSA